MGRKSFGRVAVHPLLVSGLLAVLAGALAGAVVAALLSGGEPEGVAGSAERALIERFYEESWNNGDISLIDEIFTTDYVLHMQDGRTIGRDGFKVEIPELRSAFPDLSIEADEWIMAPNRQSDCARDVARNTHRPRAGDRAERREIRGVGYLHLPVRGRPDRRELGHVRLAGLPPAARVAVGRTRVVRRRIQRVGRADRLREFFHNPTAQPASLCVHRRVMGRKSMFGFLASLAASWRRAAGVIAAWIVVGVVIVVTAPPLAEVTTNNQEDFLPGDSESRRAMELVSEKYPRGQGVPAIVVFHRPEGLSDADLAAVAEVDAALQADGAPDDIESVLSLSGSPEAASALLAPDGTTVTTIVTITGSPGEERFGEVVQWIREQAQTGVEDVGLTVALTGPAGIVSDAVKVFGTFDFRVTLFTVLLVLVLLLLIYRSPALALLPLAGVGWTLLVAQSLAAILADSFGLSLNGQVTALMSVLMFGAGTDFTLFIVARYREELRRQPDRWQAMQESLRRIGPAIASSGGTTIAAMLALLLATFGSFQAMGPVLAMAIFLMLIAGLTLIPALTVLLGRAAFWPGRMHVTGTERSRIWTWVANTVTRWPVVTFAATLVLLVVFAAGTPSLKPSFSFIDGFPDEAESKIGAQILDDSFGAGELAPTNILVSTTDVDGSLVDLDRLTQAVAAVPGVVRVSGPTRPTGDAPAVDAAALQAAIQQLPPALREGPPSGPPGGAPPWVRRPTSTRRRRPCWLHTSPADGLSRRMAPRPGWMW